MTPTVVAHKAVTATLNGFAGGFYNLCSRPSPRNSHGRLACSGSAGFPRARPPVVVPPLESATSSARFRQGQRLDAEEWLEVRLVPKHLGQRVLSLLAREEQVAVTELAAPD